MSVYELFLVQADGNLIRIIVVVTIIIVVVVVVVDVVVIIIIIVVVVVVVRLLIKVILKGYFFRRIPLKALSAIQQKRKPVWPSGKALAW